MSATAIFCQEKKFFATLNFNVKKMRNFFSVRKVVPKCMIKGKPFPLFHFLKGKLLTWHSSILLVPLQIYFKHNYV